ncbi:MAG: glycosyltransferase family 1 protein [Planctomycetota bacterium]
MGMILIDGRTIGPHLSGIGRYTLNLLAGLDAAHAQSSLKSSRVRVWMRPEMLQSSAVPDAIKRSPALDLIEYPGPPQLFSSMARGHRELRRLGVELVHCPDVFVPWRTSCRRVVTVHDVIPLVCRGQLKKSRKQKFRLMWRAWMKRQARRAIRSGGGVITVSEYSKQDIHRHLNVPLNHLHVIYNTPLPHVTLDASQNDPEALSQLGIRGPFILNVGRRDPYKNVDGLVRAFAVVRDRFADVPRDLQLVIVGQPDPRYPEAEREAQRLGLGDSVVFADYVDDAVLGALYQQAALVAMPSLYEGFGLPAVEAMRAGTPVVAGSVASLPEVVGDAGLLFDAHRPDALAEAMHKVLVDHELQKILRERGLARAQSFSLDGFGHAHMALYERLLGRGDSVG